MLQKANADNGADRNRVDAMGVVAADQDKEVDA